MMYQSDDYDDAIQLVSEGRIVLEPLMSKTFAFSEYATPIAISRLIKKPT